MSAPALSPGTDLSQEIAAAAFDRLRTRARGEAGWLQELRREAFARFQALGFPTPHDESWKYTNVAPIARIAWEPVSPDADSSLPVPAGVAGIRLAFVNGRWSRALSSSSALPAGLVVLSLAEVTRDHPEWLEAHLSRRAAWEKNAFTAWNTAFLEDGAFVRIARGVAIAGPIHLLFLSEQTGAPAVSHPRNVIVAERGAQASVVETYVGEGVSLTNSVTELFVGDGASIEHSKVQRESSDAFHVQTIAAGLDRGSQFTSHNVALGASLARTDIGVLFEGEGGDCTLNGLFLGGGAQTLDTHTIIDHAKPHCTSRELYKGILDGRSRGVFHGTILVRKDAQKTDAFQTNKNLLLSKEALVNSTPALEIFADDVKCRHGSTIGQLDAAALFYLRSRGIGEEDARALLTWAFASDVAARLTVPEVRAEVERALGLRLPGAGL